MDARTGMERQTPSMPAWVVGSKPSSPSDGATAVADASTTWRKAQTARQPEPDPRLSLDPLRATDRYRLVMPYAERV